MLNNLRARLQPAMNRAGGAFARTGLPPAFWTAIGLALAFASAASYALLPAHAALVGGALLLASGFFDMVDGQVARILKKESASGAFLDSVSDRAAEVAIFFGILAGGLAEPYIVFLAATLSLLVSYTRSRAESSGISLKGVGIGERAERMLVIALVGMAGFIEYAVIIVCVLAGITFVQRAAASYAAHSRGA